MEGIARKITDVIRSGLQLKNVLAEPGKGKVRLAAPRVTQANEVLMIEVQEQLRLVDWHNQFH